MQRICPYFCRSGVCKQFLTDMRFWNAGYRKGDAGNPKTPASYYCIERGHEMEWVTYQEYENAKAEALKGKEFTERRTYCCTDGSMFQEVTEDGVTVFWSREDEGKRRCICPSCKTKGYEDFSESRLKAIRRLYKLVYWFAGEMLEEEDAEKLEAAEFKRKCEENPEKLQFRVSAHANNTDVLKNCIREAREAVEFLRNRENDVEEWQAAGINAMFEQCNTEKIVPYDLPAAIKGVLCLQIQCRTLCIEAVT